MAMKRAIGLMSGTSMDGVDVALLETDGERIASLGPTGYWPYSNDERALLQRAMDEAPSLTDRLARPPAQAQAEALVTAAHVAAVNGFLAQHGLAAAEIDVIGFHGQTVLHRPQARLTVQLGDGQALADATGIAVAYDFRAADVAAGGQGAPLVPVFHAALAQMVGLAAPVAFLNIGGVANVTFLGGDGALLAFDTGPGNALLDDWMRLRTGASMDADGAMAARGSPDAALLDWLMAHPWFAAPAPKSLDRNWFNAGVAAHLATSDGAATLAQFTARAVAQAARLAADQMAGAGAGPGALAGLRWIVCGGGAHNPELLRLLRAQLDGEIVTAASVGLSVDFIEAQAFGYLAVRCMRGLPLTWPGTTGAPEPMTGGVLCAPRAAIAHEAPDHALAAATA